MKHPGESFTGVLSSISSSDCYFFLPVGLADGFGFGLAAMRSSSEC